MRQTCNSIRMYFKHGLCIHPGFHHGLCIQLLSIGVIPKRASTTRSFCNDCVTQLVCERSSVKKRQKAFQTKLYIDETFHCLNHYGGAVMKRHEYFISSK